MWYHIEYPDDACPGSNPPSLPIEAPYFATALNIMQLAVDVGSEYEFQAEYYANLGYQILVLNGRSGAWPSPCSWVFYVESPNGVEKISEVGVSSYVPGDNFAVRLRYEPYPTNPLSVTYNVEYLASCSAAPSPGPIDVSYLPLESTALTVMENAVFNPAYKFKATYCGTNKGFFIDAINGTDNMPGSLCYWNFLVMTPTGAVTVPGVGVSNYIVPDQGYTIIMEYGPVSEQQSCATLSSGNYDKSQKVLSYRYAF